MPVHFAKATGRTMHGELVTSRSCSGNRPGRYSTICAKYSKAERGEAMRFINYLDEIPTNGAGGKTAFTCAEPQAILDVLLQGALLDTVRVSDILHGGESRRPCAALCWTYLEETARGNGVYALNL